MHKQVTSVLTQHVVQVNFLALSQHYTESPDDRIRSLESCVRELTEASLDRTALVTRVRFRDADTGSTNAVRCYLKAAERFEETRAALGRRLRTSTSGVSTRNVFTRLSAMRRALAKTRFETKKTVLEHLRLAARVKLSYQIATSMKGRGFRFPERSEIRELLESFAFMKDAEISILKPMEMINASEHTVIATMRAIP